MASNEAKVIISADDKTGKGIASARKSLSSFGSAIGSTFKIAAAAVATAAAATAAFGASSIKAFAESQVQMARFEATIKTVTGTTAEMRQKLIDASKSARDFAFSDEVAANNLAKFYQRTKDVSQAINLNNIAMDLARAKNIELSEAGTLVNQVLSGNGKVLKQYGIELEDGADPLKALGQLHDQVKGQASAFADTLTGKFTRLGEVFGDIKEKIGEALANFGVGGLLDNGIKLLERFEKIDFETTFKNWTQAIKDFYRNVIQTSEVFALFKQLVEVVAQFIELVVRPIWDRLVQTIKDNKEMIKELLKNFGQFLVLVTATAFVAALLAVTVLFEAITLAIKATARTIDWLSDRFNGFKDNIKKVIEEVTKLINALKELNFIQGVKNVASKIGTGIKDLFRASGGPVLANSPYIVGEKGPELFMPSQSGSIVPNNRLAGAGGITINISGNTLLDSNAGMRVAEQIMKVLKQNLRI